MRYISKSLRLADAGTDATVFLRWNTITVVYGRRWYIEFSLGKTKQEDSNKHLIEYNGLNIGF